MISLPFIFGKEKFLVFEVGSELAKASLLVFDDDRNLTVKKTWQAEDVLGLRKEIGARPRGAALVVLADSSMAWTALIPVVLERGIRREELKAVELENLLAQAVGKVFNGYREEAGRCLGLEDLDIVLANSRVVDFKVDGHSVLNPVGFRSEKVEAMMELVLTSRRLLDGIKDFLDKDRVFFFAQKERAEMAALEKLRPHPIGLITESTKAELLFAERGGSVMERRPLAWSSKMFTGAISEKFGVTEEAAGSLYDSYCRKDMSEHVVKQFEKIIKPSLKCLVDGLPQSKGVFFFADGMRLPFDLPTRLGRRNFEALPILELAGKYGLNVAQDLDFGLLASFLEFYYDKSDSTINHWLRRHLNWLGSPSYIS